jgi:hypothetical protein
MRFGWDEIEDFRLGHPVMVIPFGRVIHVLLWNGEVVTLDITTMHWRFAFGKGEAGTGSEEIAWVASHQD